MGLKTVVLLVCLVGLAGCGEGTTDVKPEAKNEVFEEPKDDGFLKTNFDAQVKELPPGFKGNDWQKVVDVMSRNLKKDDYESSAEHRKKTSEFLKQAIYADVNGDGLMAFSTRAAGTIYNADQQVVTVGRRLVLMPDYKWSYLINSNIYSDEKTIGRTAFGYEAEISKQMEKSVSLKLVGKTIDHDKSNFKFKIGSAGARDIADGKAYVLYIGKLAYPYFEDGKSWRRPTIEIPIDRDTYHHMIRFDLKEIWLVHAETGKILTKSRSS